MAAEQMSSPRRQTDILALCRAIAESSPIPTAEIDPRSQTVSCVNLAFCLLTGRSKDALLGRPVAIVVPDASACLSLLDHVQEVGEAASREAASAEPDAIRWTYTMWPVWVSQGPALAVLLQVTEATTTGRDAVLINQALLLGALRQHELLDAAELLNTQLRAEMLARKAAETALLRGERLAMAGRMDAGLAQEINTPLAAAVDLLSRVKTGGELSDHGKELIDQAQGELDRIAHIAREALGARRE